MKALIRTIAKTITRGMMIILSPVLLTPEIKVEESEKNAQEILSYTNLIIDFNYLKLKLEGVGKDLLQQMRIAECPRGLSTIPDTLSQLDKHRLHKSNWSGTTDGSPRNPHCTNTHIDLAISS